MCARGGGPAGARSEPEDRPTGPCTVSGDTAHELAFARDLVNAVVADLPCERFAVHVCRGNWTPDESAALSGDYAPLVPTLGASDAGALLLEFATPRAGDLDVVRALPGDRRIGVGAVNQKRHEVENVEEVLARALRAVQAFGRHRVPFTPDCGFATFADNPVAPADVAERKLGALAEAARRIREERR